MADLAALERSLRDDHATDLADRIGTGAYGVVYRGTHAGRSRAIKIVWTKDHDEREKRQLRREVRHLCEAKHAHVIGLRAIIRSADWVALVMPLYDADLGAIMRANPRQLTRAHRRFIARSYLRGIAHLHELGIVHRDVKPENILINRNCDTVLADLGMSSRLRSRAAVEDNGARTSPMSTYVVTRWFRAPELLCEEDAYDSTIDIWSAGCVQSQMASYGVPLFAGRTSIHQLALILSAHGVAKVPVIAHERSYEALCARASSEAMERHMEVRHPGWDADERAAVLAMLAFDRRARASAAAVLATRFFEEELVEVD